MDAGPDGTAGPADREDTQGLAATRASEQFGLRAMPAPGEEAATAGYRVEDPYAVAGGFRKAQLHLHTTSHNPLNTQVTPESTARAFKLDGYDFTVFTDHDRATRFTGVDDRGFASATGYESTGASGHVGAWFTDAVVDPRLPAQRRIDAIRAAGGVAALNHPDWEVGFTTEQLVRLTGYRVLEIYNAISTTSPAQLQQNLDKWRQVLNAKGRRDPVWAVAVSDTHDLDTGGGWTVVKTAEVTAAALREAVVRGAMYATTGPEFRAIGVVAGEIVVDAPGSAKVLFVDQDGRTVHEVAGARAAYRPTGREAWVRVEARRTDGATAWSQPFWLVPATGPDRA